MSTDRLWTLVARKLAGESSQEELNELTALLADNPDLHLQLQAVMAAWKKDEEPDMQEQNESYQHLLDRLKQSGYQLHPVQEENYMHFALLPAEKKPFFRRKSTVIGVFFAIGAILVASLFLMERKARPELEVAAIPHNTNNVISTKNGSRTKIELPDGSTAWLNAGSKLTYDKQFGTQIREVHLTGEGYFDVVHDANKPFIIRTAYVDIKDLGTQFNVKCYPNDKTTEVSLVQGSVEVTMKKRPNDKWVLKPNEKISVMNILVDMPAVAAKETATLKKPEAPLLTLDKVNFDKFGQISEVAWTKNQLAFVNENVDVMATKLERWFGRTVVVQNPKLNSLQFTATFEGESIDQVLKAIQLSSGGKINYMIENEKVIIY